MLFLSHHITPLIYQQIYVLGCHRSKACVKMSSLKNAKNRKKIVNVETLSFVFWITTAHMMKLMVSAVRTR